MNPFFNAAKRVAFNGDSKRKFKLGAIGIRQDGAIVSACNLPDRAPSPHAHAEARVLKKLGRGGTIYVVRILSDGSFANARPCKTCQMLMRSHNVVKCYYSINDCEYGVLE